MIGVILWRDVEDGKAVIWCEDQGDLAYLDRIEDILDPENMLSIGDVVRFDLLIERNLRLARNVTRLLDNWGATLNNALMMVPGDPIGIAPTTGADIVPFGQSRQTGKTTQDRDCARRIG